MNDSRTQDDTEEPQRPAEAPAGVADDGAATEDAPGDAARGEEAPEGGGADAADGTSAEPAVTPPARGRGGRVLGVLALLVALAAAAAAGWLGWRLHQLGQQLAGVPDERRAALAPYARSSEVAQLEDRLATLSREQESVATEVRERVTRVEESFASLRELAGRDQVGWRMAEVRYLLAVATRRLALAGDVEAAIAALEGADDALASLSDARLLPLRERIVADLEALRAVEPADVEGVALRLRSLERSVAGLPLRRVAAETAATDDAAGADAGGSWWQRIKRQLSRFVVVRREAGRDGGPARAQTASAALAPGEALRLALGDATRAALARDARRYREAMDEAMGVVRERFAADAPAAAGFVERLQALRERPVRTDMPDLGPTLGLAERLSARLQRAASAARDDADGGED